MKMYIEEKILKGGNNKMSFLNNNSNNWELIKKSSQASGKPIPESSVSIRNGINFSRDLREFFNDSYGVEIYKDKKSDKIGFKPSSNRLKSFKIRKSRDGKNFYFGFKAKVIVPNVRGVFFAEWDSVEEMVIVDLTRKMA